MARIKVPLPPHFSFSTNIPVRITDVNYGGHVGNDSILSMIHEARMQFLQSFGYSETNMGGAGLIMTDVAIEFKNELFYGDVITAHIAAGEFTKLGFDLFYKLEKEENDTRKLVAAAKTGMVCFNYETRKVASVPEEVLAKLLG